MSQAIAFDTHRYVKRLMACGFTDEQAETLADEQVALLNANLATKADVAKIGADVEALRQETQAGMEALRQETKADIAALKADLIKWMFGGVVAVTGIFAAIVRLMVPGG